jgi:hypothetical protein
LATQSREDQLLSESIALHKEENYPEHSSLPIRKKEGKRKIILNPKSPSPDKREESSQITTSSAVLRELRGSKSNKTQAQESIEQPGVATEEKPRIPTPAPPENPKPNPGSDRPPSYEEATRTRPQPAPKPSSKTEKSRKKKKLSEYYRQKRSNGGFIPNYSKMHPTAQAEKREEFRIKRQALRDDYGHLLTITEPDPNAPLEVIHKHYLMTWSSIYSRTYYSNYLSFAFLALILVEVGLCYFGIDARGLTKIQISQFSKYDRLIALAVRNCEVDLSAQETATPLRDLILSFLVSSLIFLGVRFLVTRWMSGEMADKCTDIVTSNLVSLFEYQAGPASYSQDTPTYQMAKKVETGGLETLINLVGNFKQQNKSNTGGGGGGGGGTTQSGSGTTPQTTTRRRKPRNKPVI